MQLLRKIAFPVSLVYAVVVHLRNKLFDLGIFSSEEFSTPTICVGNLSVGGTGKTPMVEYLVELLAPKYRIAILSRGYKRKSKGFLLAKNGATVQDLGDEPYQLYKKYQNITVAVDANRRHGISVLEKTIKPQLIILDDAFQHRKVKPSLSMLLTAHGALYPNDWYLPTGNLRDSKNQAKRAAIIVVTKCPELPSAKERSELEKIIKPKPTQHVLFGTLVYGKELVGAEDNLPLETLRDKRVALITGIADPAPLQGFLEQNGISFTHFKYADHHFFSKREIEQFSNYEMVITTSKDYTRLEGKLKSLYYLGVSHAFSDDDLALLEGIIEEKLMPGRRP